jgi:hypothetical protein
MAMIRLDRLFSGRNNPTEPESNPSSSVVQSTLPEDEDFADRLRRAIAQPVISPQKHNSPHQPMAQDASVLRPGQVPLIPSIPDPAAAEDKTPPVIPPAIATSEPSVTSVDPADPVLPAAPPAERRAGRVRTRLLGHDHVQNLVSDPIELARAVPAQGKFPVGWIVVTDGPGKGSFFTLFNGVSQVGRGTDQTVCLDFGDMSISRNNHAAIAYDDEANAFFLGHGGKANLVRLNHRPVVSTEPLHHLDTIRLGETTLRLVALCKDDFRWETAAPGGSPLA